MYDYYSFHRHHPSRVRLDRLVSASSYSLFKDLPSRLRPFVLQFNIIFVTLLLLVLVTCRSQFDLYLLSSSSTGSASSSYKISSLLLCYKMLYRAVLLKKFVLIDENNFFYLLF